MVLFSTIRKAEQGAEQAANRPAEAGPQGPTRRKGRRAATSMEYVVVASFILLVVIAGLNMFGLSVSKLFTSNAAATSNLLQPPPDKTGP